MIKDLNTQIVLLKSENALLNIDKHELEKKCDERLNELKLFGEEFNKCQNEKSELEKEKKKLKEENNRLKEESRGEKLVLSSTAYQNGEKKANSIMKSFINEYKKRGSVSGVWSSVKKLVKPGPKSKLLSKYTDDMNKRKIMLDVARILTEIKITRSHWDRFEKFFNDKYRIKDKYGNNVTYHRGNNVTYHRGKFYLDDKEGEFFLGEKGKFKLGDREITERDDRDFDDIRKIFEDMYEEFTTEKRIKIYKTLNGEIVNKTKKNYTNDGRFEYIPHRRFGEGVYRLGMGARKTKKKVAKSLSNSMKKAKKMFRSMTRKRNIKNPGANMARESGEYNRNIQNYRNYQGKSLLEQPYYHTNNNVEEIRKQVAKNYRNFNISQGTLKGLGLDENGSEGNSDPYQQLNQKNTNYNSKNSTLSNNTGRYNANRVI